MSHSNLYSRISSYSSKSLLSSIAFIAAKNIIFPNGEIPELPSLGSINTGISFIGDYIYHIAGLEALVAMDFKIGSYMAKKNP